MHADVLRGGLVPARSADGTQEALGAVSHGRAPGACRTVNFDPTGMSMGDA